MAISTLDSKQQQSLREMVETFISKAVNLDEGSDTLLEDLEETHKQVQFFLYYDK